MVRLDHASQTARVTLRANEVLGLFEHEAEHNPDMKYILSRVSAGGKLTPPPNRARPATRHGIPSMAASWSKGRQANRTAPLFLTCLQLKQTCVAGGFRLSRVCHYVANLTVTSICHVIGACEFPAFWSRKRCWLLFPRSRGSAARTFFILLIYTRILTTAQLEASLSRIKSSTPMLVSREHVTHVWGIFVSLGCSIFR